MSDETPSFMPPQSATTRPSEAGAVRSPNPDPAESHRHTGDGRGRADPAALAALVARQRPAMVTLAYRLCWNRADAEDAVQEALAIAAGRLDDVRGAARLDAWIKAIVVRQALTLMRRRRGQAGLISAAAGEPEARWSAPTLPSHADAALDDEAVRVRSLIHELPERQQAAVVLRHVCDMEYPEIAAVMDITQSTARVLVRNAREALASRLRSTNA